MASQDKYSKYTDANLKQALVLRRLSARGGRADWIERLEADDLQREEYAGRVEVPKPRYLPPISSLVEAFEKRNERHADAIVLRGFLGRSDILQRARVYLERARSAAPAKEDEANASQVVDEAQLDADDALTAKKEAETKRDAAATAAKDAKDAGAANADQAAAEAQYYAAAADVATEFHDAAQKTLAAAKEAAEEVAEEAKDADVEATAMGFMIRQLDRITPLARKHVPWRIYLTPQLDTYVDFHFNDMIAYRREPRAERRDTYTVWLRALSRGQPIPYRVVQETTIGLTFNAYLGGDLVDDYLGQPGSVSTAWGEQSSALGGGRWPTGAKCGAYGGGRWPTGSKCGE